jgi:hypothetical protein
LLRTDSVLGLGFFTVTMRGPVMAAVGGARGFRSVTASLMTGADVCGALAPTIRFGMATGCGSRLFGRFRLWT